MRSRTRGKLMALVLGLVVRIDALRPPQALAIAPATEPAALAALSILRRLCCTSEFSNLQVRAMCCDEEQEIACKQAVCGTLCCQGRTRDMCMDRFPALQTFAVLTDAGSAQQMQAALRGVETSASTGFKDVVPGR